MHPELQKLGEKIDTADMPIEIKELLRHTLDSAIRWEKIAHDLEAQLVVKATDLQEERVAHAATKARAADDLEATKDAIRVAIGDPKRADRIFYDDERYWY